MLSKSKLLAYRQCPRRLWLEVHRPELREDSAGTTASFQVGHSVGEVARKLYDPDGQGVLINAQDEGFAAAFARSTNLLRSAQPIFEAGFSTREALAFCDVMLPDQKANSVTWRMVEVKSSTSVKDYHRDDVAIQAHVARAAGAPLSGVGVATIDSSWVYGGDEDYRGLLVETDLTEEAFARHEEVTQWIEGAQCIASREEAPAVSTGRHCGEPFECGFLQYCRSFEAQAEYPLSWLPRLTATRRALFSERGYLDIRDVPDEFLTQSQIRVKQHTISRETYFDAAGAVADLAPHPLPALFLDFETVQFAVPMWRGMRPYQQIPFQFSVHALGAKGELLHTSFLDLSGSDPSERFTEALLANCGREEPVFVYNAAFEKTRIKELAERFSQLAKPLLAINERIVDLLPIVQSRYYHPSQQGSWSIKRVLPAIAPDLRYDALDEIQDGGMAMTAYQEAISPATNPERKAQISAGLTAYCRLDTFAMVRIWQFLAARTDLIL